MSIDKIILCGIVDLTEYLIKSGGGTGPVMPGNRLEQLGAKSSSTCVLADKARF